MLTAEGWFLFHPVPLRRCSGWLPILPATSCWREGYGSIFRERFRVGITHNGKGMGPIPGLLEAPPAASHG